MTKAATDVNHGSSSLAEKDSLSLQDTTRCDVSEEIDADDFEIESAVDKTPIAMPIPQLNRKRFLMILVVIALALILAIVLGFVLSKEGDDSQVIAKSEVLKEGTISPTSSLELTAEFQRLAPLVDRPSLLLDAGTPQGVAFRQLLSEEITHDFDFRLIQRYAMMVLYLTLGGEDWSVQKGWSTFEDDECYWQGVCICRFRGGHQMVSVLCLSSCNLVGELPSELCLLENLEILRLDTNERLMGDLPSCWRTDLAKLTELDLHGTSISGDLSPTNHVLPTWY